MHRGKIPHMECGLDRILYSYTISLLCVIGINTKALHCSCSDDEDTTFSPDTYSSAR